MTQEEYMKLLKIGEQMTENEAKILINKEFGF